MIEKLPHLEDDGLFIPEVGSWAEDKYRLVSLYAKMFATSIKGKGYKRIYLDIFAGAGRSKIEGTSVIVPASPLLALSVADRFDKYIFCENDPQKMEALKARVHKERSDADTTFFEGDANDNAENIVKAVNDYRKGRKALTFCFVDPYKIEALKFNTIKQLSSLYIDFLVLIASYMDAHRNLGNYIKETSAVIEEYSGNAEWRTEWRSAENAGKDFGLFVADLFGRGMKKSRYIYNGVEDMKLIISTEKRNPLYHLAFFSRNVLGMKFWREALKYGTDQLDMFA